MPNKAILLALSLSLSTAACLDDEAARRHPAPGDEIADTTATEAGPLADDSQPADPAALPPPGMAVQRSPDGTARLGGWANPAHVPFDPTSYRDDRRLIIPPMPATLTVVDADGRPVAGARVILAAQDGSSRSFVVDEDGAVRAPAAR